MPHWPKPVGLLQNETSIIRMQEILQRLGNPHKKLPPVIHVAGTNGKGSTIAFMRAILEAAGKKVHAYTTPHLVEFNERILLAGKNISDEFLFEIMEEVRLAAEGLRLGFYESTTAGAFLAFSRVPADFLLLETGLGGRLDATNAIENPLITILTTIEMDHTDFLGSDVRLIAGEKVHIVKSGSTCISSLQHDVVNDVIENWCAKQGVKHLAFGADFGIELIDDGFSYLSEKNTFNLPHPALLGNHQYINAATAIAAMLELDITPEPISTGITSGYWPSRMERIIQPYVPEGWEFWLDGAHNPSGAFAIANYIEEYWADKPSYLIFCTTRGREVKPFLANFLEKVRHLCLVKINFEPNSYGAEDMLPAAEELGFSVSTHDHLKEAISFLAQKNEPGRILACGSLFMRGDI